MHPETVYNNKNRFGFIYIIRQKFVLLGLFLLFLASITAGVLPIATASVIDALSRKIAIEPYFATLIIVTIVHIGCSSLGGFSIAKGAQQRAQVIRQQYFELFCTGSYFSKQLRSSASDLSSRLVIDIGAGIDSAIFILVTTINVSVVVTLGVYSLSTISISIILIALLVSALTVFTTILTKSKIDSSISQTREKQASLIGIFDHYLSNATSLLLCKNVSSIHRVNCDIQSLSRAGVKLAGLNHILNSLVGVFSLAGQIAVLVLCGRGIANGQMTFSIVSMVVMYYVLLVGVLSSIPSIWVNIISLKTSSDRLRAPLKTLRINHLLDSSQFNSSTDNDSAVSINKIHDGMIVAILGKSGIGKSTLLENLIGVQVEELETLRFAKHQLGIVRFNLNDVYYVPQHCPILTDSIRDEITFQQFEDDSVTKVSDERKLIELLKITKLDYRLNQPFDGNLGRFGCELSTGEKERFSWVKAYFSKKRIIIFDEPTASTGEDFDYTFIEFCRHYLNDRKVFVATHSNVIKESADLVIKM